jgi:chromosome segregation ATPase
MLMPTVAYAKGNSHDSANKGGQIVSEVNKKTTETKISNDLKVKDSTENVEKKKNEEQRIEKKTQIEAFKTQMKIKHETMKDISKQTILLKKQVQTKSSELKTILNDIKEGKKTLPQDMLTALLAKSENLKIDAKELKATSDINKHLSDTQDKVNKKDFNNALSSLDNVILKLQARLDALKKLNTDLDSALAIANLATVPVPETPTVPTEDQSNVTGTSSVVTPVDSTISDTPSNK